MQNILKVDVYLELIRFASFRWLRPELAPHASYSIMQFDIPTGYHVHKKDLRLLQKRNRLLLRVRFTGGQVVLYFERVCLSIILSTLGILFYFYYC